MTEEQIKQNALKAEKEHGNFNYQYQGEAFNKGYITGAHSRDEEIEQWKESKRKLRLRLMQRIHELSNPWISVEEMLPEKGECVIFMDYNGSLYLGHHFLPTDMGKTWFADGGFSMMDDEVTHWMPIPELKKGE